MDSAAKQIRILIADDHPMFRFGLRKFLEIQPEMKVVGEANSGTETLQLAAELKPDLLLLDLAMPYTSGMETLRELASGSAPIRIVVLTASIEKSEMVEALQLGARGVILKETAAELLLKGIRSVMAGQYWVGHESVADLVDTLRGLLSAAPAPPEERAPQYGLTPREMEIVSSIVVGMTNREIAQKLGISELTVKHHLTSIFDKLRVSSRLELALMAVHKSIASSQPG